MRPKRLEDFEGQEALFGSGSPVDLLLKGENISGLIFWGNPGTGKTTLARIISKYINAYFEQLSAVHSGKKDLKNVEDRAKTRLKINGQRTVLFIDEIHRYNKAQQDGLLGACESGIYTLIGATTENPSFELINALLSRCQVLVLNPLEVDALKSIVIRALKDKKNGLGKTSMNISEKALLQIVHTANGDARTVLNLLELSAIAASERYKTSVKKPRIIELEDVARGIDKRMVLYDKTGEEHYNVISAFIKSVRGSDPQAAVYYLARMLHGGEDPVFIARRLSILASEDIGLADPQAAILASSIFNTVKVIGMPEARIPLSQLTIYLSLAPKSNSAYLAISKAMEEVKESGNIPIPKKILNAPTKLMKELGYGKDYHYAHDYEGGYFPEEFLPDKIKGKIFYKPKELGDDIS
ncbi:hypothetical protein BVX93_00115 [bacterium B13(2017)]|nr:hypothetical protein BVX93_00115 [bacterium B13(2017)]